MKRSPSLTEQVRRTIRDRISNDEFADGRIPPEIELATDLGVSRTTVRDALGRLENEGAIQRRQGSGTFVNRAGLQIHSPLDEAWSYEAILEAHGYTPTVEVIANEVVSAGADVAVALRIERNEPVLRIGKVFRENGEPVVLAYSHVARSLLTDEVSDRDAAQPVYELLEQHGGYLAYYLSEIVPVAASGDVADLLTLPTGTPLLSFEEVGFDRNNDPVLRATSFFRDDLLRFRLIRRKSEP